MKRITQIHNLLLNHQSETLEMLELLGVPSPKERVKTLLDSQNLFEVLESNKNEILAIKKKSTGEVFRKGGKFYHQKYGSWRKDIYLPVHDLFGIYYWDTYYKNYIRSAYDGGLYHLDDISLTEDPVGVLDVKIML